MSEPRTHLIWSIYHGCWHRRGSEGGANGYTDDIGQAGVFETSKAMAYHDPEGQPDRRDRAVPIAEVEAKLRDRLATTLLTRENILLALSTLNPPEAA